MRGDVVVCLPDLPERRLMGELPSNVGRRDPLLRMKRNAVFEGSRRINDVPRKHRSRRSRARESRELVSAKEVCAFVGGLERRSYQRQRDRSGETCGEEQQWKRAAGERLSGIRLLYVHQTSRLLALFRRERGL